VSRKPDGTERSGRGTAPPAAGGFGGADTALSRLARPFTPKPFRSTGGMSTSADTMMSIGMGRHNIEEELPEDQININAIVDKKVSDRRYLPRKLNNMRHFLHTTPVSEALDCEDDLLFQQVVMFEKTLNGFVRRLDEESAIDYIKRAGSDVESAVSSYRRALETEKPVLDMPENEEEPSGVFGTVLKGLGVAAPFIGLAGEVYYGTHAYLDFQQIEKTAETLEEMFKKLGADIDMFDDPAENQEKFEKLNIPSKADRAVIQDMTIKIATKCYSFLSNLVSSIPLELVPGLAIVDTVVDSALAATSALGPNLDPSGEKLVNALMTFASEYNQSIRSAEEKLKSIGKLFGINESILSQMNAISNFIGNLALAHSSISSHLTQIIQSDDPDILGERRHRKKKRANEISGAGSIAVFTGPVKSPASPRQFYDTMARVAGSEYLLDPLKTAKPKP
jgi:hypothetical protein